MQIIEIVPNYSEGKDCQKMERIISPFKKEHFNLVKLEMDESYNRSVLTVIGEVDKVLKAMLESIKITIEEIDLNHHQGEHLRIGAVDVLPIIPIKNITEKECIDLCEEFALKVYQETKLPIYLYNLSAKRKNRQLLPNIRRGEFEGLKEKMKDKEWYPDLGTPSPHPTFGVLTMGVRKPLIAFNIDLLTNDLMIAHNISRKIRFSSGGYRGVQAREANISKDNLVQVSINIIDSHLTSLYQVYESVKMEAKRYNVKVGKSEIIGLLFEEAILDTLKYYFKKDEKEILSLTYLEESKLLKKYLKIKDFSEKKIVEYYIN